MKRTKQRTEVLLSQDTSLRDSDKKLLLRFWEDEGFGLSESQKRVFLEKCTPAESITRARRALKDRYPASEKVTEQRYDLYRQYRFNTEYADTY